MKFLAALAALAVASVSASSPRFVSREGTHEAELGERVVLPCQVANLGTNAVMWRSGSKEAGELLFVMEQRVSLDERFQLDHSRDGEWNLIITSAERMDSRYFYCVVSSEEEMEQRQLLNVLVPASVNLVPEISPLIASPGDTVVFVCHPAGNPLPTVTWRRESGGLLKGAAGVEGNRLELPNLSPADEDGYECSAGNGVGPVVRRSIQLRIYSNDTESIPPWVEAERSYIPVRAGTPEVNITCRYKASPDPQVDWIRNGYKITRLGEEEGAEVLAREAPDYTLTILRIRNIRPADFGDYVCRVHNTKGTQDATIHLSGLPGSAELRGRVLDAGTVELTFGLHSPEPLTAYKVEFKRPDDDVWSSRRFQPTSSQAKNATYWMGEVKLDGLRPDTEYQLQLSARNRHGWGALPTRPLKLHTKSPPQARTTNSVPKANSASVLDAVASLTLLLAGLLSLL